MGHDAGAGRVSARAIETEAELRAALAAPGAAEIVLAAADIAVSGALVLGRAVSLRGADTGNGGGSVLRLHGAAAGVTVAAAGCGLQGIVLAGGGGRGRAVLELRGAAGCVLDAVQVHDSEGVAIRAVDSPGLRFAGVAVRGSGLEGVVLRDCDGASGEFVLADIGLHGRASGLDLVDSEDFALHVDAAGVSGSAVTVRAEARAARRGSLSVRAEECLRGLSVMGLAEAPVRGIVASLDAARMGEVGAMLVNAEGIVLARLAVAGAVALRLDGRHGARDCVAVLHGAGAEAVQARGGSRDNRIVVAPKDSGAAGLRRAALREVADTCRVCGWHGLFRQASRLWRETFYCPACRANLRYRAQAAALLQVCGGERFGSLRAMAEAGRLAGLAVYEPGVTGPLRAYLGRAGRYVQSVYGAEAAVAHTGVEVQDLMACTHADASFDLVVTSDILEHVRRPMQAFAEIRRILRPGGHHVFSIPTQVPLPPRSVARVDATGQADVHLRAPVYHGSGDGGRSLVYTDFGADILERLAGIGLATRVARYQPEGMPLPALTFVSRHV